MDERRAAPNSGLQFNFTSKGVYNTDINQTPSDDSRDLGPYDVSYSLNTDSWDSLAFENEDWNEALALNFHLINYQTFTDYRGNFRKTFNGNWGKRELRFAMNSLNFHGTRDSADLLDLMSARGAKRFYPFGTVGIFNSSGTLTANAGGDWNAALSSISDLKKNFYRGFIATLTSGAATFELQITENASGSLTLDDHRGTQSTFTSGSYNIICSYLPVEVDLAVIPMKFDNWDPQTNPFYPEYDPSAIAGYESVTDVTEPQHWEGHIRTLILRETEEDE
jgi:hypothetical protein